MVFKPVRGKNATADPDAVKEQLQTAFPDASDIKVLEIKLSKIQGETPRDVETRSKSQNKHETESP